MGAGAALLQTLAILNGFDDDRLDPSTELGAHTILEAQKLALADREAYYGDTDVPLDYLLSYEYAASRRELITDNASHDFRPGSVPGREPFMPALRTEYVPRALAGDDGGPRADGGRHLTGGAGVGFAGVGEPTLGEPTVEATGRLAAIRATSTSWTAGATWSRPLRPAAGSSPRLPYRSWAFASGPGCR